MGNIIRTGRFHLRAAVNGVTLSAAIVPDTGALAQQLNVTTGATSPSWEGGAGPRFHVEVRDMSNGREYTPVAPRLIYNGTELNFGTSTEATTNNNVGSDFDAMISRVLTPADTTKGIPARWTYQFIRSPFSVDFNQDNDTLHIEGTVEVVGGNSQSFRTPDESVLCIPTTGQAQTLLAVMDQLRNYTDSAPGFMRAYLVDLSQNSYTPITTGVTCKWYDMNGGDGTEILAADTNYTMTSSSGYFYLQINSEAVINGSEVYKAALAYNGTTYEATGVILDESDGYYVGYTTTETAYLAGADLKEGGVATVNIAVYRYDDPETAVVVGDLYPWVTLTKKVTTTSKPEVIPNAYIYYSCGKCVGTLKVGYQQLVDWGGEIDGYISLEETAPGASEYHSGTPTPDTPGIPTT